MQSVARVQEGGLRRRVQALVDRFFDGSVNGAAKAWHVAQPTLKRICDGTTANPRSDVLARIAAANGTTVEWLMAGSGGADPLEEIGSIRQSTPEYDAWDALIGSLPLDPVTDDALRKLPDTIDTASEVLLGGLSRLKSRKAANKLGSARAKAEKHLLKAWTVWISAIVDAFGRSAISEVMMKELDWLLLGYHPLASGIASTDEGRKSVQELSALWRRQHARREELVQALLAGLGPEVDNKTRGMAMALAHIKVAIGEETTTEEILRLAKEARAQLEREHAARR